MAAAEPLLSLGGHCAAILQHELAAAQRLAHDPRVAPIFDFPGTLAGAGFVEINGATYEPAAAGAPAVIFAAEAEGELVDLVACRLKDRATATRLGVAIVLGEDDISLARSTGRPLPLFRDPLHWAQGGLRGAVVVDWRHAAYALSDVPKITCADEALAARLHQALTAAVALPHLSYVREARHAA